MKSRAKTTMKSTENNNINDDDRIPDLINFKCYSLEEKNNETNKSNKYDARKVLARHGVVIKNKLASTLQGSVYRGLLTKNGVKHKVVIKRANRRLAEQGLAILGNKCVQVNENIVNEGGLMAFIQSKNPKRGFLKVFDLITDSKNHFLIMEDGGLSLFKHVVFCHQLISDKILSIKSWQSHADILFKQMIYIVSFLHNFKCCHMDISLENMVIKGCEIKNGEFVSHGQVSFCDYGLARIFPTLKTNICVGKASYQSPEMFENRMYDPRKADIWSLGVVYFILYIGNHPYKLPNASDNLFCNVMNGFIKEMITDNNKESLINEQFLRIISYLLCKESKRYDIIQLYKCFN